MRKGEIIFSIYTCFAKVYLKRNVTTFYCLFPFHALTKLHALSFVCFFILTYIHYVSHNFRFLPLNLLFKSLMILKNAMNDIRFHADINYVFMLSSLQFSCLEYKTLFYANSFFLHSKIHSFFNKFSYDIKQNKTKDKKQKCFFYYKIKQFIIKNINKYLKEKKT